MIAMVGLAALLAILASFTGVASQAWMRSEGQVSTSQGARAALELMTREMAPATIDTCQQFVVLPGTSLSECGAPGAVNESQAVFWMAPLGRDGDLRVVGYFLQRVDERNFHRLKRLYVGPENEDFFPAGVDPANPDDESILSYADQAGRVFGSLNQAAFDDLDPENKKSVVSTVAEGVVALWIQCYDLLGNPIPWASKDPKHPKSELVFNSASLFMMATSEPFEDGKTFHYLPDREGAVKGNRLPAAVEITVVTIDPETLKRTPNAVPAMTNVFTDDGTLNVEESVRAFRGQLLESGFKETQTHSTRVKLATGS
jgi:hypothetical protein